MTSQRSIPESEFPEVRQAAVDLLELLKKNLPDQCGEASSWNFEKEHSILHNVSEIVPLWGNSDNTSCQGAEHAHIELIKSVAHLTNNKDVFLCILRFHTRMSFLRHYEHLLSEVEGFPAEPANEYAADMQILCDLATPRCWRCCDAHAVFGEIYFAGCLMISQVIQC